MEEWRGVKNWFGLYEVSDLGQVRSLDRQRRCLYRGQIIRPRKTSPGYYQVTLADAASGRRTHPFVHRLVAMAFVPNLRALPQVNHLNGIKTDNRAENLEWVNQSQNNRHASVLGLAFRGELNVGVKLTALDVVAVRQAPRKRGVQTRLAEIYGVRQPTISKIILGQRWRHLP